MRISSKKREKISEQILSYIYSESPKALFTAHIAREIARDEEFVKKLLLDLKSKKLVKEIKKNPKGIDYIRRSRWKLTDSAYEAYKLIAKGDPQKYYELPQGEDIVIMNVASSSDQALVLAKATQMRILNSKWFIPYVEGKNQHEIRSSRSSARHMFFQK